MVRDEKMFGLVEAKVLCRRQADEISKIVDIVCLSRSVVVVCLKISEDMQTDEARLLSIVPTRGKDLAGTVIQCPFSFSTYDTTSLLLLLPRSIGSYLRHRPYSPSSLS